MKPKAVSLKKKKKQQNGQINFLTDMKKKWKDLKTHKLSILRMKEGQIPQILKGQPGSIWTLYQ